MAHHLVFGKIHIIEWLWQIDPETGKPDRRTGLEIYNEVRAMIAEARSPMRVILHRVNSRNSFLNRLKRIEQDFVASRRIPLLHIETHGNNEGVGLGDDGLDWPELMDALTPLNLATGCWLPVFLAACEGVRGTEMAQVMRRSPFYALMGPKREVYPSEVFRGLRGQPVRRGLSMRLRAPRADLLGFLDGQVRSIGVLCIHCWFSPDQRNIPRAFVAREIQPAQQAIVRPIVLTIAAIRAFVMSNATSAGQVLRPTTG